MLKQLIVGCLAIVSSVVSISEMSDLDSDRDYFPHFWRQKEPKTVQALEDFLKFGEESELSI